MTCPLIFTLLAVTLATLTSGREYPYYEHTLKNSSTYDLLYSSSVGPLNETLYFSRPVLLVKLMLGGQVKDSPINNRYYENIRITVIQHHNYTNDYTTVGAGFYNATLAYGGGMHITLSSMDFAPLKCNTSDNGYSYIFNIEFQNKGLYPWYTNRKFSPTKTFTEETDVPGYVFGVGYTLI